MRLVDVIEVNNRVICKGGAGTGKTFLALELARRWSGAGLMVLVVCRSPWLRHWLESRFTIPRVAVALPESAKRAAQRCNIEQFDALIVDEGQDLLDLHAIGQMNVMLAGGLGAGTWCFFHDVNNQSGILSPADPHALALLHSFNPISVPLRTNCRNTRQILNQVQSRLKADMGIKGTGNGPDIRIRQAESQQGLAQALAEELDYLVDQGGLYPGSISILSPFPFPDSRVAHLPRRLSSRIQVLDEYAMRTFPPAQISFATIAEFKGLENQAVILVDLPEDISRPESIAASYVAMSRPRAILTLIQRKASTQDRLQ
ncbi:helicase [Thiorhodovibrio winogradskyi]|uniref:Helicase n=1 Tax=Thiorhodovibrio winogradskyi TaxID=77007 RepID=A0ABZ0SHB8_9GAMM|nr:DNA/RNA helicase domain-containing protein [Thiorhodovibrio winogradskyi]